MKTNIKFAVFASGSGTVFQSIIDAKIPHGEIVALISNKADAGAIQRAKEAGIPAYFVDHTKPQNEIDTEIIKILKDSEAQFIFLAGYLKKVSPAVLAEVKAYNVHPALDLHKFGGTGMYGLRVHQAVIDAKEQFTGATIHEVNAEYDRGEILKQSREVAVLKTDTAETLQQRVLEREYKLVPKFLDELTKKMTGGGITKIVIIGGGGREHALATKLKLDNPNARIIGIPGNAGFSERIPLATTEVDRITEYCVTEKPDLVVVASDDPLALGLVDKLSAAGIRAFGPTQKAAEIEWSKHFAKDFMKRHKIPTAQYQVFDNCDAAITYVRDIAPHPLVIKANGLALGKGVVIARNLDESKAAILSIMQDKKFGKSGDTIIIEEFLTGPEITLMAFVDGKNYALMPTSQDHKRAFDDDQGPNTGGMGAFSPAAAWSPAVQDEVTRTIVFPTIKGLVKENRDFKGILYFGLMKTPHGIKVIEYNARFGDPECQTILPLLETNLLDIMNACIDGTIDQLDIGWTNQFALCVVIASAEYPGDVKKGHAITIGDLDPEVALVHCGTAVSLRGATGDEAIQSQFVTNGGRVFCLTTTANAMSKARKTIYGEIDKVKFHGARYRKDIGKK